MPTTTAPTRRLGRTGLVVSRLVLGTMTFGDGTSEADAREIIAAAGDLGVNFIDTADVYVGGRSEEIVGRAIATERSRWIVATKLGNAMGQGPNARGLSRRWMMQAVEASLRRTGLDAIDILYLHREDLGTPLEETVHGLADLIHAGKIRHFGISNFKAWRIARIAALCDAAGIDRPVVDQPLYHVLNRRIETDVLPACADFGIGVVVYSPIARGVLTGKYQPGAAPPEGSRAALNNPRIMQTEYNQENLVAAAAVVEHARARGLDPAAFAVAFVLANPLVTGAILGPRTMAHWQSYLGALDYAWTAEDEAAMDAIVPPGSTAIAHFTDPAYPVEGRPRAG